MKRKIIAFIAGIVGLISLTTLPASAQAVFHIYPMRLMPNSCQMSGAMQNDGPGNLWVHIGLYDTPPGPSCWLQIKVSYWSTSGTWYIYDSGWVGNPPGYKDWYGHQALWWVDFNTNNGGNIQGYRYYAPGCNANGC